MDRLCVCILLFYVAVGFSQNSPDNSAADEVISQIELIESGNSYNVRLPNAIACLTGIFPKKSDGTYFGIIYEPTTAELNAWKKFVDENRSKITFKDASKSDFSGVREILYEYEPKKFRSNYCQ